MRLCVWVFAFSVLERKVQKVSVCKRVCACRRVGGVYCVCHLKEWAPSVIFSEGKCVSVRRSAGIFCTLDHKGEKLRMHQWLMIAIYHLCICTAARRANSALCTACLTLEVYVSKIQWDSNTRRKTHRDAFTFLSLFQGLQIVRMRAICICVGVSLELWRRRRRRGRIAAHVWLILAGLTQK